MLLGILEITHFIFWQISQTHYNFKKGKANVLPIPHKDPKDNQKLKYNLILLLVWKPISQ